LRGQPCQLGLKQPTSLLRLTTCSALYRLVEVLQRTVSFKYLHQSLYSSENFLRTCTKICFSPSIVCSSIVLEQPNLISVLRTLITDAINMIVGQLQAAKTSRSWSMLEASLRRKNGSCNSHRLSEKCDSGAGGGAGSSTTVTVSLQFRVLAFASEGVSKTALTRLLD